MSLSASAQRAILPEARHRRPIVDVLAPLYLVLYVLVAFEPFELFVRPPGMVSSVVLPAIGVGILALTPNERLARMPISVPLFALVVWSVMSAGWSASPGSTMFSLRATILPLVMVTLVVATIPPRVVARTMLALAVSITLWSLVVSLVLPMSRAVALEDGLDDQAGFRGTFGHKNFLGVYAVLALAIALPLLRSRWRRVIIVGLVIAALTTRSATTAGGLAALSFVWFWMRAIERGRTQRDRKLMLFVSTSSAVIGLLAVLRLLPVLLDVYDKDITFSGRTIIWGESFAVLARQPWHGYGLAGVWTNPPTSLTHELWNHIGFRAGHTHNGLVELLLDLGIVGASLGVLFILSVIRLASRASRDPELRPYGRWGLLFCASLVIMSLAEPLFANHYLAYLAIVWATLASMINQRRDRAGGPRRAYSTTF